MNYTYLLRCADGTLYCGWTNRLEDRVAAHNAGRGAKYTKSRRPVELIYYESYQTKEEAMRREAAIKKLTRAQKQKLLADKGEGFTIIISPAKRMQVLEDELPYQSLPVFYKEAEKLLSRLKEYTEPELKKLFGANDSITHENFLRYRAMDLSRNLTPAVLSYVGIQYQYLAPRIFSAGEWTYICNNLRILSGFYGVLRADDGIVPYRLEMQAALSAAGGKDLYGFWSDKLYKELAKDKRPILNLASKEYSKAVEPYLHKEDQFVTCIFGAEEGGLVKVKATQAKMCRGEMVRFLAERGAASLRTVKEFNRLGFSFSPERSSEDTYVFLKHSKELQEDGACRRIDGRG